MIDRRAYDSAFVHVLLEDRHEFVFEVQDWDLEDRPLRSEDAWEMARDLIHDDRVPLHGKLDGKECSLVIPVDRVIVHWVEPVGLR